MNLTSGTKLGPYEIVSLLGAGGMGEVYRARDARLKRDVAVKVLPQALSLDADRLRRFEQEALATAALNHPNILAVFDIGTHEGAPYVVSELLEGETLRERLRSGAIAMRKTLEYALQISHGLAAAQENFGGPSGRYPPESKVSALPIFLPTETPTLRSTSAYCRKRLW